MNALYGPPEANGRPPWAPTDRGPAVLRYFYGPMNCGKSALALQIDHNHARQGRRGILLTALDRSGQAQISSRIGLVAGAAEVAPGTDLRAFVAAEWAAGHRVDYLICDEAQFYLPAQIEQAAELVDRSGVDVYAFGLATDFRGRLFPASARLFELADELIPLQVEVLCWCGRPGRQNARVIDGAVVREGAQVVVADTGEGADVVHYQVLCRRHHHDGDLGPDVPGAGQMSLEAAPVTDPR